MAVNAGSANQRGAGHGSEGRHHRRAKIPHWHPKIFLASPLQPAATTVSFQDKKQQQQQHRCKSERRSAVEPRGVLGLVCLRRVLFGDSDRLASASVSAAAGGAAAQGGLT